MDLHGGRYHEGDLKSNGAGVVRLKGAIYKVIDLTLGGGRAMQYTDHVSWECTLETCIILLPSVTPGNLIKINKMK